MIIGETEGNGWRYEIIERTEGFLVRMRDIDTGEVERRDSRIFRTAPVAFAYIELSAAFERYAVARIHGDETNELLAELRAREKIYNHVSRQFQDDGITTRVVQEWQHEAELADRRRYH